MKEKLYTIPIQDAFSKDCECPVCEMYRKLEENAINYTIGPGASYMEEDIRAQSDEQGFCPKHLKALYEYPNKLGLAHMLKTHMDCTIKELEKAGKAPLPTPNPMLKKKQIQPHPVTDYIREKEQKCFVCGYINQTFESYLMTIFYLYEREAEFRVQFQESRGFCVKHYRMLYERAPRYLNKKYLEEFLKALKEQFLENYKRVRDDLEWFICKNDYRYKEEPWKNGRDALPRALTKIDSITFGEE